VSDVIQAYPLQWPAGWRRTESFRRERAKFSKGKSSWEPNGTGGTNWVSGKKELTVADGVARVLEELGRMNVSRDDVVISTNVPTRLDGLPRGDARVPQDPGAAVYWRKKNETRCMAIDRYNRVQDNLAAIAATLEAMRAIERHGGASILDRAFQGFSALAAPEVWWQTLGLSGPNATREQIDHAYKRLVMQHHPDRGTDADRDERTERTARINRARDLGLAALS
jgi:hypothetical protein